MPAKSNAELAKTCHRYYESCLWSSTIYFIMLGRLRKVKAWVAVIPILIGTTPGLTTVLKLTSSQQVTKLDVFISIMSFLSGMMPLIYNALKLDDQIEALKKLAAESINLRDRFRTALEVSVNKSLKEFEEDLRPLIERIEKTREAAVTTPDWAYDKAKKKIDAGHYSFQIDEIVTATGMTVQMDTESLPNPSDSSQ